MTFAVGISTPSTKTVMLETFGTDPLDRRNGQVEGDAAVRPLAREDELVRPHPENAQGRAPMPVGAAGGRLGSWT